MYQERNNLLERKKYCVQNGKCIKLMTALIQRRDHIND